MRLPWPFSRPQQSVSSTPEGEVFGAFPTGPQAWRDLPVLGMSVGTPPLIAPTPSFRADLAGAAAAPIALAPLTHGHGLHAPTGLARGLARPVDANATGGTGRRPGVESRAKWIAAQAGRRYRRRFRRELKSCRRAIWRRTGIEPSGNRRRWGFRHPTVIDRGASGAHSFVSAAGLLSLPLPPVGRIATPKTVLPAAAVPVVVGVSQPDHIASPIQRAPASTPVVPPLTPTTLRSIPDGDRLTLGQSRRRGLGAPIDPEVLRHGSGDTVSGSAPSAKATQEQSMPVAATPVAPQSDGGAQARPLVAASGPPPGAGAHQSPAASPTLNVSVGRRPATRTSNLAAAAATTTPPVLRPPVTRSSVQRAPHTEAEASPASLPLIGARVIGPAFPARPIGWRCEPGPRSSRK